jgi:hypothetical protein
MMKKIVSKYQMDCGQLKSQPTFMVCGEGFNNDARQSEDVATTA